MQNSDKETALHCASQHGHVAAVQVLLEHGADPNIKNCRDETALDLASLYGRYCRNTVKKVLNLSQVSLFDRVDTVELLLKTHPELVGPYTAYGGAMYSHTPLHLASRNGHREIVEMILSKGFDINVRTARGTALHEAALCGKGDVLRTLLQANVNVELRDQDNKTVLELLDDLKTPISNELIHIILGRLNRQKLNRREIKFSLN